MRLIEVFTLEVHEFEGDPVPSYAILSHRWEEDEVSLQDIQTGNAENKRGWSKLRRYCGLAAEEGWSYVWIDTCCIDKKSSSELSEAINSMFEYYQKADVCHAYLSDAVAGHEHESFKQSRWFTRGWTLQELLAPVHVMFLNRDWKEIGTKLQLHSAISSATGISAEYLIDFWPASIAQKMSWAAQRKTTRIEDQAYCLLGLFGVNMPLLYGEQENAFLRLQLEIIKVSNDQTIFAWTDPDNSPSSILADCPRRFAHSRSIIERVPELDYCGFSMTSTGLRGNFEVATIPNTTDDTKERPAEYFLRPNAASTASGRLSVPFVIRIAPRRFGKDIYHRLDGGCGGLLSAATCPNLIWSVRSILLFQELKRVHKPLLQYRLFYRWTGRVDPWYSRFRATLPEGRKGRLVNYGDAVTIDLFKFAPRMSNEGVLSMITPELKVLTQGIMPSLTLIVFSKPFKPNGFPAKFWVDSPPIYTTHTVFISQEDDHHGLLISLRRHSQTKYSSSYLIEFQPDVEYSHISSVFGLPTDIGINKLWFAACWTAEMVPLTSEADNSNKKQSATGTTTRRIQQSNVYLSRRKKARRRKKRSIK